MEGPILLSLKDICCTCLSIDRKFKKLCEIEDGINNLFFLLSCDSEAYELLCYREATDLYICWECTALLNRMSKFREQACTAQKQLQDMVDNKKYKYNLHKGFSVLSQCHQNTYNYEYRLITQDENQSDDEYANESIKSDNDAEFLSVPEIANSSNNIEEKLKDPDIKIDQSIIVNESDANVDESDIMIDESDIMIDESDIKFEEPDMEIDESNPEINELDSQLETTCEEGTQNNLLQENVKKKKIPIKKLIVQETINYTTIKMTASEMRDSLKQRKAEQSFVDAKYKCESCVEVYQDAASKQLHVNEAHKKMESRSKRLVNLALATEKSNIPVVGISADKYAALSSGDARSNTEEANLNVDNAASSGSSWSESSSSSSCSTNTFFYEDNEDSPKNPNYVVEPQRRSQSSSDSDGEVGNVNKRHQDGVSREIVIRTPTEDHELILNRLAQEADTVPIVNEPSDVNNVRPTEQNSQNPDYSSNKKGKKRRRLEDSWKHNIAKRLRNSGKSYQSVKTKKIIPERKLGPPCRENCSFKCRLNITDDQRQLLLKEFWNLGDIEKQWSFIANSVETVVPKHRYVKVHSDGKVAPTRDNNNAFFFTVSGIKIRVCKLFFKNTLAINNRPIETALKKKNKNCNISSMKDDRGHHGKQYKVDENIKNGVKTFIEAIPKMESDYIRANSRKHYIDGSKAITDLHRDYVAECKSKNVPFANYIMFYRIFTQDYNKFIKRKLRNTSK